MSAKKIIEELNKLVEQNGNTVNANLNFANKMLKQVPEDKREKFQGHIKDINEAISNLDKGKLMDIAKDLKTHVG